jgi:hypothetical protein
MLRALTHNRGCILIDSADPEPVIDLPDLEGFPTRPRIRSAPTARAAPVPAPAPVPARPSVLPPVDPAAPLTAWAAARRDALRSLAEAAAAATPPPPAGAPSSADAAGAVSGGAVPVPPPAAGVLLPDRTPATGARVAAEWLHIVRPLLYRASAAASPARSDRQTVGAMAVFGRRSWRAWGVSLAADVASTALTRAPLPASLTDD